MGSRQDRNVVSSCCINGLTGRWNYHRCRYQCRCHRQVQHNGLGCWWLRRRAASKRLCHVLLPKLIEEYLLLTLSLSQFSELLLQHLSALFQLTLDVGLRILRHLLLRSRPPLYVRKLLSQIFLWLTKNLLRICRRAPLSAVVCRVWLWQWLCMLLRRKCALRWLHLFFPLQRRW